MAKSKSSNNKVNNDIKGVIFITLGVLILFSIISIFFKSLSPGLTGKLVRKILFFLIGIGAFFLPFVIIFMGYCYIIKKNKVKFNSKFYGIIMAIINTLLLIQMINLSRFYNKDNLFLNIGNFYDDTYIWHGGIISYLINIPMYKLFGKLGSYIIYSSLYIISFILIFGISIYDVFKKAFNGVNELKKENKTAAKTNHKEDGKLSDEALIVESKEKNNFVKAINNKIKIIDFIKSNNIDGEEDQKEIQNSTSTSTKYNIHQEESSNIKENEVINKEMEEEIAKNSSNDVKELQYEFPSIEFLRENETLKMKKGDKKELLSNASKLQETLSSFGVNANVVQVTKGPSVTRFEIQPEVGVKVSKIVNLSDDIALNLAASGVRIEAPIPGKAAVGIEVPNKDLTPVYLREVIESDEFKKNNKNLAFCLGKDIGGNCVVGDLSKMPHLLVAGATGSGKSVCINTLIISLLYKYSPAQVRFLLIDPKVVELSVYNGIPHLLIPVVTDPKKSAGALNWAVNEMTKRYKLFAENGVRNIEGYNELFSKGITEECLPSIVIVIDELADLMMVCPKDVEDYIARLAQMARAAGMHLVIATQRPSVDVITGMIKANIPSRISFAVSSQIDSRTILDSAGAEKLLGKGDMLFYPVGEAKPIRIQGAFISEEEVEKVVNFVKEQKEQVDYKDEILEQINSGKEDNSKDGVDDLLNEAIKFVIESGYASTSMLQRKFKIGYNRAARIIDDMEERSIISGRNGSKPRQVLVEKSELD